MERETDNKQSSVEKITQEFQFGFTKQQTPEERVRFVLDFMRSCLAQEKRPNFKHFWEAKPICIDSFKEEISPYLRESLWMEYLELTSEAKKLKQILDEQFLFNEEQLKLAVEAIESDSKNLEALIIHLPKVHIPETLNWEIGFYTNAQAKLHILHTLAVRIVELRKELLGTDVRSKKRSELLERLKIIGDQIFPERKELAQTLSERFEKDIKAFVEEDFPKDRKPKKLYYVLKAEIKDLQTLAKQLTLVPSIFSSTRLTLSECWDRVREWEGEKKKEVQDRLELSKKNRLFIEEKIEALTKALPELSSQQAINQLEGLFSLVSTNPLSREDQKELTQKVREIELIVSDKKLHQLEKDKQRAIDEILKDIEKIEKIEDIELQTHALVDLLDRVGSESLSPKEVERLQETIDDLESLVEKKRQEQAIETEEELTKMYSLEVLMRERAKKRLESCRKLQGLSGLDFATSLHYQQQLDCERKRIKRADQAIERMRQSE